MGRAQRRLGELLGRLGVLDRAAERLGPLDQRRALVRAGGRDLLADRLLLGPGLVGPGHGGPAGLVGGQQPVDERFVGPAGALGRPHPVGVGAQQPQINHGSTLPGCPRRLEPVTDRLPIKMLHDRILVRVSHEDGERRSSGGILIPATAQVAKRLIWAEVLAIGNHVRSVEVGRPGAVQPR